MSDERLRHMETEAAQCFEWRRLREDTCKQHEARIDAVEDDMAGAIRRVNERVDGISVKVASWSAIAAFLGTAIPIAVTIILWYASR